MREVVEPRIAMAMLVLMLMGGSIVYGIGSQAAPDVWIAIILALAASVPFILIYSRLVDINPESDVFQTLESALGRPITTVVSLIYGWYALTLLYHVVNRMGHFVSVAGLVLTPRVVPRIVLIFLALLGAKCGVEVMARWSSLFLRVIMATSLFAFILVLKEIDPSNLKPIMYNGFGPVLEGALTMLEFPFLEPVLFIFVGISYRVKNSGRRVFLWGQFLAGTVILFIMTITMMVVGPEVYRILFYPVYGAVSQIDIGGFFTRLEITVTFLFLITTFVKSTICLIVAGRCLSYIVGEENYRYLLTPLAISALPGTFWIIEGTLEMDKRVMSYWPPLEFASQIVIPVILWSVVEIRLKNQKKQAPNG